MADFLNDNDDANGALKVEISARERKENSAIQRTSSFQERIQSETPGGREIDAILYKQNLKTPTRGSESPRRSRGRSPTRGYSPTRGSSVSPSRRERSVLRMSSPDKPMRQSEIWGQWGRSKNNGDEYLQEYNVKQMRGFYGKSLGGKVEAAQEWYMKNGLDRSKTQSEALDWLVKDAIRSATASVSCTPMATQTEPVHVINMNDTPRGSSMSEHKKFVGNPYKNKEMKAREMLKEEKNLNKLSHRSRVQRTPNVDDIRAREDKFKNDAIVTERRRTRFKDIIPQYDASADRHCKAYFKRKDVQKLITVTRSREANPLEDFYRRKTEIARKYSLFVKDDKENGNHVEKYAFCCNRMLLGQMLVHGTCI